MSKRQSLYKERERERGKGKSYHTKKFSKGIYSAYIKVVNEKRTSKRISYAKVSK